MSRTRNGKKIDLERGRAGVRAPSRNRAENKAKKSPSEKIKEKASGGLLVNWSVTRLTDERTGALSLEFTFRDPDGARQTRVIGAELTYAEILRELRKYSFEVPPGTKGTEFVEGLIKAAPKRSHVNSDMPGWKTASSNADPRKEKIAAYVTPSQIFGPDADRYRLCGSLTSQKSSLVGRVDGSLEDWNEAFYPFVEASNYIAFCIMCGLAGPAVRFAVPTESPCFNLFGPSSVGKTGAVKAGAAVVGHPDSIQDWSITRRALEETAAAYNDQLLVLNAAERLPQSNRKELLGFVAHSLVDGASSKRSSAVKNQLPELSSRNVTLSTSNLSGRDMAENCGLTWALQEEVRFIDIQVPSAEEGGIFDQLGTGDDRPAEARQLIHELEDTLSAVYGALLEPWIQFLMKNNSRQLFDMLTLRFVKHVGARPGAEERVARKFGLVYAAGRIAVAKKILDWPKSRPREAAVALFSRWREHHRSPSGLCAALSRLKNLLQNATAVPISRPGEPVAVQASAPFIGVRASYKGREVIGLRQESLVEVFGTKATALLLEWLKEQRLVESGHGQRTGMQLPVPLKIKGQLVSKPRLLVIDPSELTRALGKIT
ncbi:MAG: DUF927 domain-containing protein [Aurantimonas endophytica]|uniref:DUF927 domain-containing protein n=1 Tax=Aurantimonas endophytica TaxID=1522175 RepID=UPI00300208AB